MLIFNILIILSFFTGVAATRNYGRVFIREISVKKTGLLKLYPLCLFLLEKAGVEKLLVKNEAIKENLGMLFPDKRTSNHYKAYLCRKISIVIIIFVVFSVISLFQCVSSLKSFSMEDSQYIQRPQPGEDEKEVCLDVVAIEDGEEYKTGIHFNVGEQRYKDEKLKEQVEYAKAYIDAAILGKNRSLDAVVFPLNLIKDIPDTGIKVSWDLDIDGYINIDGTVNNQEIKKGGVLAAITAVLQYYDMRVNYEMVLKIMPEILSKEEALEKELLEEVKKREEESRMEEKVNLPRQLGNKEIYYKVQKSHNAEEVLFFGILAGILIFILQDKELEGKVKKRNTQLMIDYPEIINKFTLLLSAGLTVKNAWGKIVMEYMERKKKTPEKIRFAYEEMLITWNELGNNISEERAFDHFGKRVNLMSYLKFSSLLTQNIKKGSRGLLGALELEAVEAFEERKTLARRLGEEAGTKLLAPMMIMLLIVMLLIVIPAFISFM